MLRLASRSVPLDVHKASTNALASWAEEAEDEVSTLKMERDKLRDDARDLREVNDKLRADLAASEALLYESEAWRAKTVEALEYVKAERDDALSRIRDAASALRN